MLDLKGYNLSPSSNRVFQYFEEISAVPRGSGDRIKIADYCERFAESFGLKYVRDREENIIIYKNGTKGNENAEPIILQGHLDIVCQCTEDCKIDFLNDPLDIYRDGDYIKARGTTLGADNGIAVSYILAILASDEISHPPIEAVFTADEEIGLLGANALDTSLLKAKRMINLDSESDDILTVSCAGGEDVVIKLPLSRKTAEGYEITLGFKGLTGGHSGVEINKGRINADILLMNTLKQLDENCAFELISVSGGSKPNAIPQSALAIISTNDLNEFALALDKIDFSAIKQKEPDFYLELTEGEMGERICLDNQTKEKLLGLLNRTPNGVMKMSEEIEGLVETSLNLGILSTEKDEIIAHFALRSNKEAALKALQEEVADIASDFGAYNETFGFYPPWEYKADSPLRELYKKCYKEKFGKDIKVEAIHAGLECAVFAGTIKNLDCISVGPDMQDVHTPNEKLNIPSAIRTFELLLKVLEEISNL